MHGQTNIKILFSNFDIRLVTLFPPDKSALKNVNCEAKKVNMNFHYRLQYAELVL